MSSGHPKRTRDDRSESGSQVGSSSKQKVSSSGPYSATRSPAPPPPEKSSAERINTPDEDDELFDGMMAQVKTNPPEEFSGARGKLTQFFTQSALYIYNNQGHFQDDEKRIMFMISYLRGDAYKLIEPFLTEFFLKGNQMSMETRRTLTVLQAFQEKLTLSFGSIDEERKADREIRALRQTASAGDYAVKFERLKAYLSWNDESYRSQFFNGLKWEVKDQLLKKETQPDSLSSLIDMAIKLDDII